MSQVLDPTDYVIRARWDVAGEVPGLGRVQQQISRVESAIGGMGGRIFGALAGAAGIAGIAGLVKQVVGLNSEVQNAEYGIASLFSSLAHAPMAQALGAAREQVKGLQQDAAKGAGDLQDYLEGFQTILGPAGAAGASIDKIRELNRLALAAGFALRGQMGLKQAPLDIVQALTGGAHDRTTPIVEQALRAAGISDTKFNAMSGTARIEALMKGFGTFREAADAMGRTWDARVATFGDDIRQLEREVSKPLFDAWADQLGEANDWLQKNKALLDDMANNAGRKLLGIWATISAHPAAIGSAATGLGTALAGGRLAGMAAGAAGVSAGPGAIIAGLGAAIVGFVGAAVEAAISKFPDLRARLGAHLGLFGDELVKLGAGILKLFENPWMAEFGEKFAMFGDYLIKTGIVVTRMLTALAEQFDIFFKATYSASQGFLALGSGDKLGAQLRFREASDYNRAGGVLFQYRMQNLLDFNGAPKIPEPKGSEPPVSNFNFNFNGPVTVEVKAERLDDPTTAASTFRAAMKQLTQYPRAARGAGFVPKPT